MPKTVCVAHRDMRENDECTVCQAARAETVRAREVLLIAARERVISFDRLIVTIARLCVEESNTPGETFVRCLDAVARTSTAPGHICDAPARAAAYLDRELSPPPMPPCFVCGEPNAEGTMEVGALNTRKITIRVHRTAGYCWERARRIALTLASESDCELLGKLVAELGPKGPKEVSF